MLSAERKLWTRKFGLLGSIFLALHAEVDPRVWSPDQHHQYHLELRNSNSQALFQTSPDQKLQGWEVGTVCFPEPSRSL